MIDFFSLVTLWAGKGMKPKSSRATGKDFANIDNNTITDEIRIGTKE